MSDDIPAALIALVRAPSEVTYRSLWSIVVGHTDYAPYSGDFEELERPYNARRYHEVQNNLREMMPNWLLSPRAHQIACLAAKHLGDVRTAAMELRIAEACIQGVLATGDGTIERPYLVTRIEDEYDILIHLGKQPATQSTRHGRLDSFQCTDGTTIWFNIGAAFEHLGEHLKQATPDA